MAEDPTIPEDLAGDTLAAATAAGLGLTIGGPSGWWYSDAAKELFGVDPSAPAPNPLDLVDPTEASLVNDVIAEQRVRGAAAPIGVHIVRGDGARVPVELTVLERGQRIVAWWRDVSAQHRSESFLMQSDRMATLGSLAAGLAHEINNPLASVQLNLGFLRRALSRLDVRDDRVATILDRCEDATSRVATIVRDLRSMARHDVEHRMAVDPRQVLDAAITVVSNELKHRAEVVRDYDTSAPVWASEAELGQVFMNLLLNAADAIGADRLDGVVTARVRSDAEWIVVDIEDNGPGIPEAQRKRIFDPFFTTKAPGHGTGMGLTICENAVHTLGGLIKVEAREGGGTRFRVTLPAAHARVTVRPTPPQSGVHQAIDVRLDVLVVDDDEDVALSVGQMLEEKHEVTIAVGGEAARQALRDHSYDIVICDVVMPGISGITLYREFEGGPVGDSFIFMSAANSVPPVASFLDHVDRPRLRKPIDAHQLGRRIREVYYANQHKPADEHGVQ